MTRTLSSIDVIINEAAERIQRCLRGRYLALLLIAGAARGEVTFDVDGSLLSDLDFLVILPQSNVALAILEEYRCRRILRKLTETFAPYILKKISVGFANSVPRFWEMATPLMWELRMNGRVLDGLKSVKEWPAIDHAEQIPPWEGVRLIANRLCELLGALGEYWEPSLGRRSAGDLRYASIKMVLACSEAVLIEAHKYRASYHERWNLHSSVAARFNTPQNELIEAAYRAKIDSEQHILNLDAFQIAHAALELAFSTLKSFGLATPTDLAARTRTESPTAPGRIMDLAFFVRQLMVGRRAPWRRAIASVYADGFALALKLADDRHGVENTSALASNCRWLLRRFKQTPQVVSVLRAREPL